MDERAERKNTLSLLRPQLTRFLAKFLFLSSFLAGVELGAGIVMLWAMFYIA